MFARPCIISHLAAHFPRDIARLIEEYVWPADLAEMAYRALMCLPSRVLKMRIALAPRGRPRHGVTLPTEMIVWIRPEKTRPDWRNWRVWARPDREFYPGDVRNGTLTIEYGYSKIPSASRAVTFGELVAALGRDTIWAALVPAKDRAGVMPHPSFDTQVIAHLAAAFDQAGEV